MCGSVHGARGAACCCMLQMAYAVVTAWFATRRSEALMWGYVNSCVGCSVTKKKALEHRYRNRMT